MSVNKAYVDSISGHVITDSVGRLLVSGNPLPVGITTSIVPEYMDAQSVRNLFPEDWEVTELHIEISWGENIQIRVERTLSGMVNNFNEGIDPMLQQYLCRCESKYSNGKTTSSYNLSVPHEIYVNHMPGMLKEILDKRATEAIEKHILK